MILFLKIKLLRLGKSMGGKVIATIPVRGGSKGVKQKILEMLVENPLYITK